MPYPKEAQRKGGQASRTHGLDAIAARGSAALGDVAAMDYRELRDALRLPDAREEVKLELMARLVTMARVGFDQMGVVAEQGGDPFEAPVMGRLGGYLNLLARLLNSFPQQERADHARLVGEMTERVEKFTSVNAKAKADMQTGQASEDGKSAPEQPGSRLEEDLS